MNYCDSLSCLHALEHFGLGRYGDNLDVYGYRAGLANMVKILKSRGKFYLSTPIGSEKVVFNSHRVFNPKEILSILENAGLSLVEFSWFDIQDKKLMTSLNFNDDIHVLSEQDYSLGIFTFIKN